jgi:transcriptional regulator with XRE-family HTH domain
VKSTDFVALGARIRQVRDKLGLTQEEFAAKCGFPNSVGVGRYEAGRPRPDLRLLVNIARAGGVSLEWLLTGSEDKDAFPRQAVLLVREAPGVYQSLLDDLAGDRRLLQAVRDLIAVLQGPDKQAAEWLLGNITVFAERARQQTRKRGRKVAG